MSGALSLPSASALNSVDEERKERKSIYIAPFILCTVSKGPDMDHTVLLANSTMPAFPS